MERADIGPTPERVLSEPLPSSNWPRLCSSSGSAWALWVFLTPRRADTAYRWAWAFAWRLGPRAVFTVQNRHANLQDSQLVVVGMVAFLYAALFAVEGVGLWMSKRWAAYLTIIATSSFVPFEVYELIRHASWQRGATLGINLLVVGYLAWRVRQRPA